MEQLNIAVIYGGDSSEAEVSERSAREVFASLDRTRYNPTLVHLSKKGWVADPDKTPVDKNDFSLRGVRFDYALIMIHGTPGENGILQGYFDLMDVPYSTPSVEVSALTFNKRLTKMALRGVEGIKLAREVAIRRGETFDTLAIVEKLGLPLFVKPNASGSSCGVTKVKAESQLSEAIREALKESDTALLEENIAGIEISQGVMICSGREYVLPITELVSHNEFFDYHAKYTPGMTDEITPARISAQMALKVSKITLEAYKRLGCRGVVRMDYILRDDEPYFIEVNTVPGMSAQSIVPQQWAAVGLTMGEGFDLVIQDTIRKN